MSQTKKAKKLNKLRQRKQKKELLKFNSLTKQEFKTFDSDGHQVGEFSAFIVGNWPHFQVFYPASDGYPYFNNFFVTRPTH